MRLEKEEKVISDFIKSIGPWGEHVVIGGGYALMVYKLYFGKDTLGNPPIGTTDVDTLLPRKIPTASKRNIAEHLGAAGFRRVIKDSSNPPTESYNKQIDTEEIEIEFLTDNAVRGDKERNVSISGVVAQPLSYLSLSLQKTMKFKINSGESGRVVVPSVWMFHKGLTFPRRKSESKRLKDLYGIWYVTTQLGHLSNRAIKELIVFRYEHPSWFKTFRANLSSFGEI